MPNAIVQAFKRDLQFDFEEEESKELAEAPNEIIEPQDMKIQEQPEKE